MAMLEKMSIEVWKSMVALRFSLTEKSLLTSVTYLNRSGSSFLNY